jgi:uncharacterized CHY-type Zn-finger protein
LIPQIPKYKKALELKQKGLSNSVIADILNVKIKRVREYLYKATHYEKRQDLLRRCNRKYYNNNIVALRIKGCEYSKRNKDRYPKEHLGTVIGGVIKIIRHLNKRDYPIDNICELCYKKRKTLVYHHWDNSNFNKGMWICTPCHVLAGKYEKGYSEKYFKIKQNIDILFLGAIEISSADIIEKDGLKRIFDKE